MRWTLRSAFHQHFHRGTLRAHLPGCLRPEEEGGGWRLTRHRKQRWCILRDGTRWPHLPGTCPGHTAPTGSEQWVSRAVRRSETDFSVYLHTDEARPYNGGVQAALGKGGQDGTGSEKEKLLLLTHSAPVPTPDTF